MSDKTPDTPSPQEPNKRNRDNSLQDKKQANEIAFTSRLLETIAAKDELKAALAKIGYDDDEFAIGAGLQATAFKKFNDRQTKLAVASQDKEARDQLTAGMEEEHYSYRQTVQALYKGPERTTLGASGRVSKDMEILETTARSSYTTALAEPYATRLATRGFSPERTAAALATLDVFVKVNTKSKASMKAAGAATRDRNAAVKAMNAWVAELKKVSRANLKKEPALLALLKE